jgi:hypothetical protein
MFHDKRTQHAYRMAQVYSCVWRWRNMQNEGSNALNAGIEQFATQDLRMWFN